MNEPPQNDPSSHGDETPQQLPSGVIIFEDDMTGICPRCQTRQEWVEDYFSLCGPGPHKEDVGDEPRDPDTAYDCGMIWCSDCNGKFVLDPYVSPIRGVVSGRYGLVSLFALATVELLVDSGFGYWAPSGPLDLDTIADLAKTKKKDGLVLYDREDPKYQENRFFLGWPVESVDAFSPKTPFPEGFKLQHDGRIIALRCLSQTGKRFNCQFDGD